MSRLLSEQNKDKKLKLNFKLVMFLAAIAAVIIMTVIVKMVAVYENAPVEYIASLALFEAEQTEYAVEEVEDDDEETRARNEAWVRDIRFLESNASFHPLLSPSEIWLHHFDTFVDHSSAPRRSPSMQNPELRIEFASRIQELIQHVPMLEDYEILYSLLEILSVLGDSHTSIAIPGGELFPLHITYIDNKYYVRRIHENYEHLLFSELTLINGVSVDFIFQQMKRIDTHEGEYMLRGMRLGFFIRKEFLSFIGVIESGSNEAVFTFVTQEGEIFNVNLTAALTHNNLVDHTGTDGLLRASRPEYNYWHEFLSEYGMMYIRYSSMHPMTELPFAKFHESLIDDIQKIILSGGRIEKIVFDFRDNLGGASPPLRELTAFLDQSPIDRFYILINNQTYSAAVIAAIVFEGLLENAMLVGEPAAQPPNFFAMDRIHATLPENGTTFMISRGWVYLRPEYEDDVLRPDIYIPRTLEAFINNRDLVLEAIKSW